MGCCDGAIDICVGVCGGSEQRFVLRRRDEDAAAEHVVEELGEERGV